MNSMPQHPFLRRVITNIYNDGHMRFDSKDNPFLDMVIDYLLMNYLQQEYHMKYRDEVQRLADDILIYDSRVLQLIELTASVLVQYIGTSNHGVWKERRKYRNLSVS